MSRFLLNDASLHGQFASLPPFLAALGVVFQMRDAIQRSGFRLEVNRLVTQRAVINTHTFHQVISRVPNPEIKRSVLSWLDKDGPFWDDPPVHSGNEYFECEGEVVTGTALAEACTLMALFAESSVLSLTPSKFSRNPLAVFWRDRADGDQCWQIANFLSEPSLVAYLRNVEKPPASWRQLLDWTTINCPSLQLSPEILSQLPTTFFSSAAQRAQVLFKALHEINSALLSGDAKRFEELRRLWMEGDKARMTDSSDAEKADFAAGLNFKHPVTQRVIACTWHAKIKTPQLRIHFEWPKQNPQDALFIAYFGPKLTKR
jgi:hypothetical protein